MNKKSGKAGTSVEPIAPAEAFEADEADPGQVAAMKAEQRQTQKGKYGSVQTTPFRADAEGASGAGSGAGAAAAGAGADAASTSEATTWIEIELVGEDDKPVPGARYRVTLPDGAVDEGTLDHNGWARIEGFADGACQVTFPDLDQEAWEFLSSSGARPKES